MRDITLRKVLVSVVATLALTVGWIDHNPFTAIAAVFMYNVAIFGFPWRNKSA